MLLLGFYEKQQDSLVFKGVLKHKCVVVNEISQPRDPSSPLAVADVLDCFFLALSCWWKSTVNWLVYKAFATCLLHCCWQIPQGSLSTSLLPKCPWFFLSWEQMA